MKHLTVIALLIFIFAQALAAQQVTLTGKITESKGGTPLSFANLRVKGTTGGTAANQEGEYSLKLAKGKHTIIASFIGYRSDTVTVTLSNNLEYDFVLSPIPIRLEEVTVLPGINPALAIIERAIEQKNRRDSLLNSYVFTAYTKGIIKTTEDLLSTDSGFDLSLDDPDSTEDKLKITAIMENESKGYYKEPDQYKEEIIARKQTSNLPSSINILTGGRIIQNFYSDDIEFFDRPLLSPLADDALSFYFYYIRDTLAYDNQTVFEIYFAPDEPSDPGFYGNMYITDKTYDLVKMDVYLNSAANPGGLFDEVNVFQQYLPYGERNIYMPVDYRIFVRGNFLGLVEFGYELNSIMYDYEINSGISDSFFDMAVITVKPDADKKEETYWNSIQTIPTTESEAVAYERIDSLESQPTSAWSNFLSLSDKVNVSKHFHVTGPIGLYHFNKVEGHALNMGLSGGALLDRRFRFSYDTQYGFADERFKQDFYAEYLLGKYRTTKLSLTAYHSITNLFRDSDRYNKFTSTWEALTQRNDFREYYYTNGFEAMIASEIFPVLELRLGFMNRTDRSATNQTNYAFFDEEFLIFDPQPRHNPNEQVYDVRVNAVKAGFKLDFRKYIEDGYFRRRVGFNNPLPVLSAQLTLSDEDFGSEMNFKMYEATLDGGFSTLGAMRMRYEIKGVYSDGAVPYQMLYSLPGNIESSGKNFSFRTLQFGEVYGDRVATIALQHDFRDDLFRWLSIPGLKDLQLQLGGHFTIGWLDLSSETKEILPTGYIIIQHPYYEAGFSLGHILLPLKFEFTWRLNNPGFGDSFMFGINTFIL